MKFEELKFSMWYSFVKQQWKQNLRGGETSISQRERERAGELERKREREREFPLVCVQTVSSANIKLIVICEMLVTSNYTSKTLNVSFLVETRNDYYINEMRSNLKNHCELTSSTTKRDKVSVTVKRDKVSVSMLDSFQSERH